jgi:hypothetical protein
MQHTTLPGTDTTRRTGDGRLLPQCCCSFCFHFLASVRRGSAVVVPKAGGIWLGLRFLDGHRAIFQERDDLCAIYLQAPVVADQALLLELVHEFTYPRAGGTNHLRQG